MSTTTPSGPAGSAPPSARLRAIIVGAGFGGVGMAIELRRHGFTEITILEAGGEIGGTWSYNTYPGAACDVPSHLYSYSFAQRRDWSRLCSPQAEILRYLQGVADAYGITPLVRTGTRVTDARWDEAAGHWEVTAEGGEALEAEVLIVATGQLNQPAVPDLPGRERFRGHSFHSARWDHDYDLRGRRIGVVGTGASAVQFVPAIAPHVAHLTVFQRTGNWMLPRENRRYAPAARALIQRIAPINALRRRWIFWYGEFLTLLIRHPRTLGRIGALRSTLFMRRQLPDPELRAKAWPDYTFGCKRVLFSSHYLPTLGRPDVELVTDAIREVTESGLRTADGREHELDCIIWSTGFRPTEFMFPMQINGAGGVSLREVWSRGAHAHLGMTVPGFPSLFIMYGPNTNTSGGSIIYYLERQAAYIRQAMEQLRAGGHTSVEVRADVEAASDRELQARFAGTAWTDCDSWYRDEDGRIVANWPGYMREYAQRTARFAPEEFTFA
ncbi:MAG TPA: NAD(P)/FAD-dependent oxidoreductase [Solirubrobacteraceae bacterium]|nr:NAD(P)/FAD-dependent oxidoreductase [Solirubrobacteraceae bacterium]